MRDFRSLEIWKRSYLMTIKIYKLCMNFPKYEEFGLTSQLRRATVSIGANIAEGSGRQTNKDFMRFISISLGSLYETEYLLLLAFEFEYISEYDYKLLCGDIRELRPMITAFMRKLKEFEAENRLKKRLKPKA